MGQCFHCGENTVVWDSDFSFEDMGYEGEGIVHCCHCTNCGADIEYRISLEPKEDEGSDAEIQCDCDGSQCCG